MSAKMKQKILNLDAEDQFDLRRVRAKQCCSCFECQIRPRRVQSNKRNKGRQIVGERTEKFLSADDLKDFKDEVWLLDFIYDEKLRRY